MSRPILFLNGFFLYQLIHHEFSSYSLENSYSHKYRSWMVSFLHEPLQHVYSSSLFVNCCSHKSQIWLVFILHEWMQQVFSCYSFENSCSHKCHIWMAFFASWTIAISVFKTAKNNSHLLMDISCHFQFCHNRKNGFRLYCDIMTSK